MPLSTNQRTGLLAFAIVGGLFLLVAGVLFVTIAMRAGKSRGTDPGPVSRRPAAGPTDSEAVKGHKWWARPLTDDELGKVVAFIMATNNGNFLYISDRGVCYRGDRQPNELAGKRMLFFQLSGSNRPNRADVLALLRAELDAAEFRDGPGVKPAGWRAGSSLG